MLDYQQYRDEINTIVINALNEKLKAKLSFRKAGDDCIVCWDEKTKRTVIVVGDKHNNGFIVRGVLKKSREQSKMSYSFNGQPGKNCIPYPKSGQGEEWCIIELPKYVGIHGNYYLPNEIDSVVENQQDFHKVGQDGYYGSTVTLKTGAKVNAMVPVKYIENIIAQCA